MTLPPLSEWLMIRASQLIDGTGAPPVDEPTIVVHQGVIHRICVGRPSRPDWPPETPVVSLPGHTLLPGLIDAHVHLVLPGDGTPFETSVKEPDGVLMATAVRNAHTALRAGITTLRDCGGMRETTLQLRRAQSLGMAMTPRLHLCGCPLTMTGGHCWYFGGEADGPEGMRRIVRGLVKAGVDYIKIMASGGGTRGTYSSQPSYTVEELSAGVDEAHRLNKRAGIHCTCAQATRNAVAAGADHIEHAIFLTDEKGRQEFQADVADAVAHHGTPVTSTLSVGYFLVNALLAKDERNPEERSSLEQWQRINEATMNNARRMRQAGVRHVAGTDAGWRFTPFNGLVTELELLRETGASAQDAIAAATSLAAAAIGIADETGSLREGLQADIIAVMGDPLANLAVVRHPAVVILGGSIVIRNSSEENTL